MNHRDYFSVAIKLLLLTAIVILLLNFACARGAGVYLLNFFGLVAADQIGQHSNVLRGVILMQGVIKVVAFVGLSIFSYFMLIGIKQAKSSL